MNKNTFKTFVLLAAIGGLLVSVGSILGGRGGAVLGMALGFGIVGFSYWRSDKLAIRAARAVPADEAQMPEYFRIVRELTEKAGMPMPRLYVTPDMQPNAFATGRNPEHAAVSARARSSARASWSIRFWSSGNCCRSIGGAPSFRARPTAAITAVSDLTGWNCHSAVLALVRARPADSPVSRVSEAAARSLGSSSARPGAEAITRGLASGDTTAALQSKSLAS